MKVAVIGIGRAGAAWARSRSRALTIHSIEPGSDHLHQAFQEDWLVSKAYLEGGITRRLTSGSNKSSARAVAAVWPRELT
jgi:hypothetical protein